MAPKKRSSGPSAEEERSSRRQALHPSNAEEAVHSGRPHKSPRTSRRRSETQSAAIDDSLSSSTVPEETSRRESTSSMRTSATPLEGPVTYTPTTHRISKAKKGKRVHACEFPGCGKVFTRNEHKRRHEANHNPEVSFTCDRADCRKTFYRPDLLQRHQERHEMEQDLPKQHRSSQQSISSIVPMTMPMPNPSPLTPTPGIVSRRPGEIKITSLVNQEDQYRINMASYGPTTASSTFSPGLISSSASNYSLEDSPRITNHSRTPSTAISTIDYPVHVTGPLMNTTLAPEWDMPNPPSSWPSSLLPDEPTYAPLGSDVPVPISFSDLDGLDYTVIHRELSDTFGVTPEHDGTGVFDNVRCNDCLVWYWQYFHPLLPILHQPTFFKTNPSPLLMGLMIAIGSQYDTRPDAQQYSTKLLEVVTARLRTRDAINNKSRLADMQTVLLLEILTRYRSRRTEVGVSSRFRTLYTTISDPRQWSSHSPLALFRAPLAKSSREDLSNAHKFWVDTETKRRIFHAATMIDLEQHILFEQPLTVIRQHGLPQLKTSLGHELPLPCDSELWESSPVENWAGLAANAKETGLETAKRGLEISPPVELDDFQRRIVMTNWMFESSRMPKTPETPTYAIPTILTPLRYQAQFTCYGVAAFKATRIHDLLTVSGESWLLGKKLDSEAEFHAAKQRLREWVDAADESNTALWYATKLLRVAISMPEAGKAEQGELSQFRNLYMLHEQWMIYIATLICWAYGFKASQALSAAEGLSTAPSVDSEANSHHSSTSSASSHVHPCLIDVVEADMEMGEYLRATDVQHASLLSVLDPQVIGRTAGLLETVRMRKLAGHTGGLLTDAERVLYRLVEGKSFLSHF